MIAQVLLVAPPIADVPLYHCHVLAPVFSESESVSPHVPALQVNVFPTWAVPVMVGTVREATWSG